MKTNKLFLTFVDKDVFYDLVCVFKGRDTKSYIELSDNPGFVAINGGD